MKGHEKNLWKKETVLHKKFYIKVLYEKFYIKVLYKFYIKSFI